METTITSMECQTTHHLPKIHIHIQAKDLLLLKKARMMILIRLSLEFHMTCNHQTRMMEEKKRVEYRETCSIYRATLKNNL